MKAILQTNYGSPDVLQLREVEKPTPKEHEVLVKVHAASINAVDYRFMRANPFFIRLMGGTITVNSQVGKGSIFAIHLPLKEGDAQAVQAKDMPRHVTALRPGQGPCRVLIADDIEDNRQLLAQFKKTVHDNRVKWAEVARAANISID